MTVWEVSNATPPRVLHGHRRSVYGVAWSPDGGRLATGGVDQSIQLWNAATGMNMQVLQDDDGDDTVFFGLAWSPDGQILASGTLLKGVFL